MNGLVLMREIDCRTSASTLPKASSANGGRSPVSCSTWGLHVVVGERQHPAVGVWMRIISSVPSSRCEITRERMASPVRERGADRRVDSADYVCRPATVRTPERASEWARRAADMLSGSVPWLLGACGAYGRPQSLQ
jgi:hypothetical protein